MAHLTVAKGARLDAIQQEAEHRLEVVLSIYMLVPRLVGRHAVFRALAHSQIKPCHIVADPASRSLFGKDPLFVRLG